MEDIFGRMAAIFLAVSVLFGMPLVYMQERAKTAEQMYLLSVDAGFVDSVCNTGFISMEMYRGLCRQLEQSPGIYDMYLVHEEKELVYQNGEYSYVSTFHDEQDILAVLETGQKYRFAKGDYLKLALVKKKGGISFPWLKDNTLNIFYGGTVKYEII